LHTPSVQSRIGRLRDAYSLGMMQCISVHAAVQGGVVGPSILVAVDAEKRIRDGLMIPGTEGEVFSRMLIT
jgi:hypothetical protein